GNSTESSAPCELIPDERDPPPPPHPVAAISATNATSAARSAARKSLRGSSARRGRRSSGWPADPWKLLVVAIRSAPGGGRERTAESGSMGSRRTCARPSLRLVDPVVDPGLPRRRFGPVGRAARANHMPPSAGGPGPERPMSVESGRDEVATARSTNAADGAGRPPEFRRYDG